MSINEIFVKKNIIGAAWLISVISSILGLYSFIYSGNKVNLTYEILSATNVLELHEDLGHLDITYNRQSIKKNKDNLKIYTVKIINNGDKVILKEFYDDRDPLGLTIKNGSIIEKPNLIDYSSSYIKNNLNIELINKKKILFSPLILENSEYYILKLLVLHDNKENPIILPLGKIAGIKEITLINDGLEIKDNTFIRFFYNSFSGNFYNHLIRTIVYFIVGSSLIIISVVTSSSIRDFFDKRERKKMIDLYKKQSNYSLNESDEKIFKIYLKTDYEYIKQIEFILTDGKKLNKIFKDKVVPKKMILSDDGSHFHFYADKLGIIEKLIHDGFVKQMQRKLLVDLKKFDRVKKFNNFLEKNGVTFKDNEYTLKSDIIEIDDKKDN